MNQQSRDARKRLREATRDEFEGLIYEALLTPLQEKIIRLHIADDVPVCYVAERLSCSEARVRKKLTEIYQKVAKVKRNNTDGFEKIGTMKQDGIN